MSYNKTDGVPQRGCPERHDMTQHRLDLIEDFMLQTFYAFERHVMTEGSKWKCCQENINPSGWPVLAKVLKWDPGNDETATKVRELNVSRPPVITHTASRRTNEDAAVQEIELPLEADKVPTEGVRSDITDLSTRVHNPPSTLTTPSAPSRSSGAVDQPTTNGYNGGLPVVDISESAGISSSNNNLCTAPLPSILAAALLNGKQTEVATVGKQIVQLQQLPVTDMNKTANIPEHCGISKTIGSEKIPGDQDQIMPPLHVHSDDSVIELSSDPDSDTEKSPTPVQDASIKKSRFVTVNNRNSTPSLMGIIGLPPPSHESDDLINHKNSSTEMTVSRLTRNSLKRSAISNEINTNRLEDCGRVPQLDPKTGQVKTRRVQRIVSSGTTPPKKTRSTINQRTSRDDEPSTHSETASTSGDDVNSEAASCEPLQFVETNFSDGERAVEKVGKTRPRLPSNSEVIVIDEDSNEGEAALNIPIIETPNSVMSVHIPSTSSTEVAANSSATLLPKSSTTTECSSSSSSSSEGRGSATEVGEDIVDRSTSTSWQGSPNGQEHEEEGNIDVEEISSPTPPMLSPTSAKENLQTSSAEKSTESTPNAVTHHSGDNTKCISPTEGPPTLAVENDQKFKEYRDQSGRQDVSTVQIQNPNISDDEDVDIMEDEPQMPTVLLECTASEAVTAVRTPSPMEDIVPLDVEEVPVPVSSPHVNNNDAQQQVNASATVSEEEKNNSLSLSALVVPKRTCTQRTYYCTSCQAAFESVERMQIHRMQHEPESAAEDEREKNDSEEDRANGFSERRSKRKRKRSTRMRDYVSGRKQSQKQDDSESEGEQQSHNQQNNTGTITVQAQNQPGTSSSSPRLEVVNGGRFSNSGFIHILCPYCKKAVSRIRRWEHLRACKNVTEDQMNYENSNKGNIDLTLWIPVENNPERGPGRQSRSSAQRSKNESKGNKNVKFSSLTDTEGNPLRKGGCGNGAKTDWSLSDEEPLLEKVKRKRNSNASSLGNTMTRRLSSVQGPVDVGITGVVDTEDNPTADSGDDRNAKKLKVAEITGGPSTSVSTYPTVPYRPFPPPVEVIPASDDEMTLRDPNFPDDSIDTDVVDEEDLDVTCIVEEPSVPASQASTTTTAVSTPGTSTRRRHRYSHPREQCQNCKRMVVRSYLQTHMLSKRCKPMPDGVVNGYETCGDDSQTETEAEENARPAPRPYVRTGTKPNGKCSNCGTLMQQRSFRNHVKRCVMTKGVKEGGGEPNWVRLAEDEDSQTEAEEDATTSTSSKFNNKNQDRVACKHCGLEMLTSSIKKHLTKCRALQEPRDNNELDSSQGSSSGRSIPSKRPRSSACGNINYCEDIDAEFFIGDSESGYQNELTLTYSASGPETPIDLICMYEDCCYESVDAEDLKEHLKMHPLGKGFACRNERCDKVFIVHANMVDHERTHIRSYPHDATMVSIKNDPRLQPKVQVPKV